jgi:hypothetical protein
MFITNRYKTIYHAIVDQARSRGLKKTGLSYFEIHHILPTSLGGTDTPDNKVLLTAREHFICHLLLTKFATGTALTRMCHAFSYMVFCRSSSHQRKITSRWYATAREMSQQTRDAEWRKHISDAKKGKNLSNTHIENMSKALTGRVLSDIHRANISINHSRHNIIDIIVIDPNGEKIDTKNLRGFCREHGLNYRAAANNINRQDAISRGSMKGWNFLRVSPC